MQGTLLSDVGSLQHETPTDCGGLEGRGRAPCKEIHNARNTALPCKADTNLGGLGGRGRTESAEVGSVSEPGASPAG
eukprot:scaffold59241_cov22-Tisochrysis_lutea.AAC.1